MDKFKIEDLLDEDLIFMNVRAADSESLLHTLSEELQTRGCVAVLDEPVAFKEMGDGIRDVMVNIVFLLAVCGSNDQLTILQKIVGMFSDADIMADIKGAADRTALHQILKKHLSD